MAHHAHSSKGLGQPQNVGVDPNHDPTLISLQAHRRVHQFPDGITELTGCVDAALAAGFEEVLFELLKEVSVS